MWWHHPTSFLLYGWSSNIYDVAPVLTGRPLSNRVLNPWFRVRALLRVLHNLFTCPAHWLFCGCSTSFLFRRGSSFEYSSWSCVHIIRFIRLSGRLLIWRLKLRLLSYLRTRWWFLKKRFNLTMQEIILIILIKYTSIKPLVISIQIIIIPCLIVKHQHDLFPGGQGLHRITWLQKPHWFLSVVLLLKNQLVDCENSCVTCK